MKIKHTVKRVLVWDNVSQQMVLRWNVSLYLLGKNRDVIMESGFLYAETSDDVEEARTLLKNRLKSKWYLREEQSRNL
jgi:hypothetical protein